MLRHAIALGMVLTLLGGCATNRVSMTDEQRAKITELEAQVIVIQDEIIAEVPATNGAGLGLIGVVISNSITNSRVQDAQQIMGPFYASIEDVDFRREFNQAMLDQLKNYPIKVGEVKTTPRMLSEATFNARLKSLKPGQALLLIVPRYAFSQDFRNLNATATISVFTAEGGIKPVQKGIVHYQSVLAGPGGIESIKTWSADNASLYRADMQEAVSELSKLILLDVQVVSGSGKSDTQSQSFPYFAPYVKSIKGKLLTDEGARILIVGADDQLYSLPKGPDAPPAKPAS